MQWPENYDFVATRAINHPVSRLGEPDTSQDELELEEDDDDDDDDLDPVKLDNAFKFASWSSIALVNCYLTMLFS